MAGAGAGAGAGVPSVLVIKYFNDVPCTACEHRETTCDTSDIEMTVVRIIQPADADGCRELVVRAFIDVMKEKFRMVEGEQIMRPSVDGRDGYVPRLTAWWRLVKCLGRPHGEIVSGALFISTADSGEFLKLHADLAQTAYAQLLDEHALLTCRVDELAAARLGAGAEIAPHNLFATVRATIAAKSRTVEAPRCNFIGGGSCASDVVSPVYTCTTCHNTHCETHGGCVDEDGKEAICKMCTTLVKHAVQCCNTESCTEKPVLLCPCCKMMTCSTHLGVVLRSRTEGVTVCASCDAGSRSYTSDASGGAGGAAKRPRTSAE